MKDDNKIEPVVIAAMPLADGGQLLIKSDGSKVITNGKGQVSVFDKECNPIGETFSGGSA
jgi:hypothetical protein